MSDGKIEYSFLWFIENYSFCWHKTGEVLRSPEFIADGLDGTTWYLGLYPRGVNDKAKGWISLFLLRRAATDSENYSLNFELSILATDGSTLVSRKIELALDMKSGWGWHTFLEIDKIFLTQKPDFLPQDILSVRCKVWKDEANSQRVTEITARTRIRTEDISFRHLIEGFSKLAPNETKTVQVPSPTKKESDISSKVYFTDGSWEGKVMVDITSSKTKLILSKCKISLQDVSRNVMNCKTTDNRSDPDRRDISKLPLSLTRKAILNRKSDYLPGDTLCLLCECTFSSGIEYENIVSIRHDMPPNNSNQLNINDKIDRKCKSVDKLSEFPSALDDLESVYNTQCLTDVQLKTATKSFPAHKCVLVARSSVFQAMLTHDMKEKNTDYINVDDLENDTLQKLLLFLYTDKLENLQWESALKLYYAGDKYDIKKLKVLCSTFLANNLSVTNVCELLVLADTHNDPVLKKLVGDFILEHEEEVFGSDEWEKLIEDNPKLVVKTMHLKYRRNKVN